MNIPQNGTPREMLLYSFSYEPTSDYPIIGLGSTLRIVYTTGTFQNSQVSALGWNLSWSFPPIAPDTNLEVLDICHGTGEFISVTETGSLSDGSFPNASFGASVIQGTSSLPCKRDIILPRLFGVDLLAIEIAYFDLSAESMLRISNIDGGSPFEWQLKSDTFSAVELPHTMWLPAGSARISWHTRTVSPVNTDGHKGWRLSWHPGE